LNAPDGWEVDHRNGDRTDNRRCNLRLCDKSQNIGNSKIRVDNTSGFKGVIKLGNSWVAKIHFSNKDIHIGCYRTSEDAAYAYNQAALKYFGEFAFLNELPDGFIGSGPIPKHQKMSKYTGVYWYPKGGKWVARIKANRKSIHLGYFDDEERAAKAFEEAKLKYRSTV
jgi:hypothetical protein